MESYSEPIEVYFPNGAPIIVQVAFARGYGPALMALNEKVYFNADLGLSPLILEAIQCACLSSCDNRYCAIMHARGMVTHGLSLEEVRHFAVSQELPERVPESPRWSAVLRRIHILFRTPEIAPNLYTSLRGMLQPGEQREMEDVIAFALLHKFLLEAFYKEIDIASERILFDTVDCGHELIETFTQGPRPRSVLTICCACKDLKTAEGWVPIEHVVARIFDDHVFSHGLCPKCFDAIERTI